MDKIASSQILKEVIEEYGQHICNETLAIKLATSHLPNCIAKTTVQINGETLIIELSKV